MMIAVESLRHAIELVGARRLARWLQLLLSTVEEPSAAAATLSRAAVIRGRMLELLGAEYFEGTDCDNLFLVGAFSMLPSMLMQPIGEIVAPLALPEAVADALTQRQGRYGPLLELAEAMEAGSNARVEALCERLTLSGDLLVRAHRAAQTTLRNEVIT
jgi:EAL and modified HD-GYP domain-containing signal transduction protein